MFSIVYWGQSCFSKLNIELNAWPRSAYFKLVDDRNFEAFLALKRTESSRGGKSQMVSVTGMTKRVESRIAQNEVMHVELLPQTSETDHKKMTLVLLT